MYIERFLKTEHYPATAQRWFMDNHSSDVNREESPTPTKSHFPLSGPNPGKPAMENQPECFIPPWAAEKISRTKGSGDVLSTPATGALSLKTKSLRSPMSAMSIPIPRFPADLITKSWESHPKCRLNIALPNLSLAKFQRCLKWRNEHFLLQSLDRFWREVFGFRDRDPRVYITRWRIIMTVPVRYARRHGQVKSDL